MNIYLLKINLSQCADAIMLVWSGGSSKRPCMQAAPSPDTAKPTLRMPMMVRHRSSLRGRSYLCLFALDISSASACGCLRLLISFLLPRLPIPLSFPGGKARKRGETENGMFLVAKIGQE